jgi:hypothetical protein
MHSLKGENNNMWQLFMTPNLDFKQSIVAEAILDFRLDKKTTNFDNSHSYQI